VLTFPVYIPLGPVRIHPHLLFETLAYFVGFRLYLWLRRRSDDHIAETTRMWVVVGAIVGAAIGSKLLYWFEEPTVTLAHLTDFAYLMAGKSIVGGLIGGLVGVEWTKKLIGERRSTGDLFVIPLCVGMAIGRIGCFLTGLEDHTHGVATALPWAVDFGDGIGRHPTQLYEIVAMLLIALWSYQARRRGALADGDIFKGFMLFYLLFRLGVEFIKPDPRMYLGLSGIQVACVAGLLYYLRDVPRVFWHKGGAVHG
jgi:phosphatidylglycerol:prolipoprotein diacylglycerol transferase